MRSLRRARRGRPAMRYYIWRDPGGDDDEARMNGSGTASAWDTATQAWIVDPLLSSEITSDSGWTRATIDDLPAGASVDRTAGSGGRRGFHTRSRA